MYTRTKQIIQHFVLEYFPGITFIIQNANNRFNLSSNRLFLFLVSLLSKSTIIGMIHKNITRWSLTSTSRSLSSLLSFTFQPAKQSTPTQSKPNAKTDNKENLVAMVVQWWKWANVIYLKLLLFKEVYILSRISYFLVLIT